ncbi:MAG: tRNA pseudouridine(55) synthase TruB [Anaerovoracaceae bacterium]
MTKENTLITQGIINLNKPEKWTSHDCVAVMRGIIGMKRIGHTGTLDPMATGVLPICLGTTTRIMEYMDLDFKTYECEMKLGLETDTQDIWGQILNTSPIEHITEDDVRRAFAPFHGTISQIPPKYSAVKIDGKRLYEYAREGKEVTVKSREIYIKELLVNKICLEEGRITYTVTCSKGTYIRTICQDVGESLGCGATMSRLTRVKSGIFSIENAIDMEDLKKMEKDQIPSLLTDTDKPLVNFGKIVFNQDRAAYFCNGGHIRLEDATIVSQPVYKTMESHITIRDEYRKAYNIYNEQKVFLGVAFYDEGRNRLIADKVFYRG